METHAENKFKANSTVKRKYKLKLAVLEKQN